MAFLAASTTNYYIPPCSRRLARIRDEKTPGGREKYKTRVRMKKKKNADREGKYLKIKEEKTCRRSVVLSLARAPVLRGCVKAAPC
jgi:hypothetical protein